MYEKKETNKATETAATAYPAELATPEAQREFQRKHPGKLSELLIRFDPIEFSPRRGKASIELRMPVGKK